MKSVEEKERIQTEHKKATTETGRFLIQASLRNVENLFDELNVLFAGGGSPLDVLPTALN